MTIFDHHIGKKTEAICDQIWVVIPRHDHTNIIVSIQSDTEKNVNFEMMKNPLCRPRFPIVVVAQGNESRFFQFRGHLDITVTHP